MGLPVGIAEALERGATVVTGNQRAARELRQAVDRRNRARGMASWRPAAVMAWDTWTAGLWRELVVEGRVSEIVLNRTQEHAVWKLVLEAEEELATLRSVESLAEMAMEAWKLLCAYNGERRLQNAAVSDDSRAFRRWARTFERVCGAERFLAQAQVEGVLRRAVGEGWISGVGGEIVLVGFDRLTPAQMGLVEALRGVGVVVEEMRLSVGESASRMLIGAGDEREELSVAARWVRGVLEERPGARVAVVVPGLEDRRAEIDRVFREVLAPELEDIAAREDGAPYEFSVGRALAGVPMMAVALDLLRWAVGALPLERVSGLLLSPYFGMVEEERGARAAFDAFELRKARMLRPEISLEWLIVQMARARRRGVLTGLLGRLRAMRVVAATRLAGDVERTHAEWTVRIGELLEAAGWGAREEDSVAFQTRRKWESALDELVTADFDGVKVGFGKALEELEWIARHTMFAPESRDAPVQVMGPLEAAGSTFDALWFLGVGDLSWPMAARGSSLLPWQLQREMGVPGTDVARDAEDARRMTERIAWSAGAVVFSYAKETAEGRQRPSPALVGLGLESRSAAGLVHEDAARTSVSLEEIEDGAGVMPLPDRVVHGGARILELQADCGFRAFAERRLWSAELESVDLGLDARENGTVVHTALELFWNEMRTQAALKAMPWEERERLLRECIESALSRADSVSVTAWDAAYLDMQRERLQRLLRQWLDLEMRRPPFEVKLSERKLDDARIGPLRLSVRVDRVDVVDGAELIIDYKTGHATPNEWLTERPDSPQLPLYAVLSAGPEMQGVAFGLVRAGKNMELKGYAGRDGILAKAAKMRLPLEAQVDEWRRVLVQLATEFQEGQARVSPKRYPATCKHCAQRVLCRLDVSALEEELEESDGSAAEVGHG
ncbi:putative DNA repair protein [Edaphobacter aggregans]|uniref:Putative DNA repair protein n=1 Tax=Edaphobacter aggregans TaxID=570835 RepID=A0A3R9NWQ6_9BACT|nr:PD-(D/E)XK nuclease family protein [Edaphobacter aggregans]RSL15430.1 putative DNA repair protein [Edaphobacter aggregans]